MKKGTLPDKDMRSSVFVIMVLMILAIGSFNNSALAVERSNGATGSWDAQAQQAQPPRGVKQRKSSRSPAGASGHWGSSLEVRAQAASRASGGKFIKPYF